MEDLPDNEVPAFLEAIVSYQKDDNYRPSLQYSPEFRIAFRHAMDDIDEYDARSETRGGNLPLMEKRNNHEQRIIRLSEGVHG